MYYPNNPVVKEYGGITTWLGIISGFVGGRTDNVCFVVFLLVLELFLRVQYIDSNKVVSVDLSGEL